MIIGSSGTITVDAGGITLKGNVTVKGTISVSGGHPTAPEMIDSKVNEGKEFDLETFKMRIKQTFAGEYITNAPYQLTLGGKVYEGEVDNSGTIQHELPKGAKQGILKLYPYGKDGGIWNWAIDIQGQKKHTEVKGMQSRLANMGFYQGKIDGDLGKKTRRALRRMQKNYRLVEDGEYGEATKAMLNAVHDY